MTQELTAVNGTRLQPYKILKGFYVALLMCCTTTLSDNVYADKAQWELGIGLTVMDIPFYPGSSQNKTYVFPIPHILYRSEKLEIDNDA